MHIVIWKGLSTNQLLQGDEMIQLMKYAVIKARILFFCGGNSFVCWFLCSVWPTFSLIWWICSVYVIVCVCVGGGGRGLQRKAGLVAIG